VVHVAAQLAPPLAPVPLVPPRPAAPAVPAVPVVGQAAKLQTMLPSVQVITAPPSHGVAPPLVPPVVPPLPLLPPLPLVPLPPLPAFATHTLLDLSQDQPGAHGHD